MTREKVSVRVLGLSQTWPFPAIAVSDAIDSSDRVYVVENNATGQLSHLIQAETGRNMGSRILKFDGRPFMAQDIAQVVKREVC